MKAASLIAGLLLACASPALAASRDQLGQRDAVTIDPARAYIFYRSNGRGDVRFLREVDAREQQAWEQARAAALARAHANYRRDEAAWRANFQACGGRVNPEPLCAHLNERPVDVTDDTFYFPPPELDNFVAVLGGRQFTRDGDRFTYLIAVPPGSYILYGEILGTAQNGSTGVCLCMGSVRFEAPAGRIVDMGDLRFRLAERGGDAGDHGYAPSQTLSPPTPGAALPDRLNGLPVVPAILRAADKMPNYFGVLIDRLPAIPGVLGYERDRVIDLAAGEGAAPAP